MMKMTRLLAQAFAACMILGYASLLGADALSPKWQDWSDTIFDQAKAQHRLVLLDLEAIWCHWCHVMDQTTYHDPKVVSLLNDRFIALKVDQDSRPDLSNRYGDYGWPATILFDETGRELAKRRGYLEPQEMADLLNAVINHPEPEGENRKPKIQNVSDGLSPDLRAALEKKHKEAYDPVKGGLKTFKKSVDRDSVEYSMSLSLRGDAEEAAHAQKTLTAAIALIDPVWGGVYQYSTDEDWKSPHYEKLTRLQGDYMRIYALAYDLWKDPAYLKATQDIARYLAEFQKTPNGAYQTSQDADLRPGEKATAYYALGDSERRQQGIPRIDPYVYPSDNGPVIRGFAALYAATGDVSYLNAATTAAQWLIRNRSFPDSFLNSVRWFLKRDYVWPSGAFRHDETDAGGPYLADTLAMGQAFLSLYGVTGDRSWLERAEDSARFIRLTFETTEGYRTAFPSKSLPDTYLLEEHIQLARFANLLYHFTGNLIDEGMAKHALRFLSDPSATEDSLTEAGVLIADDEVRMPPLHVTVVGPKGDAAALGLFKAAIALPQTYRRIEWCDKSEGPMPNPDVTYPDLGRAAAFLCTNRTCSRPIFKPEDVRKTLEDLEKTR